MLAYEGGPEDTHARRGSTRPPRGGADRRRHGGDRLHRQLRAGDRRARSASGSSTCCARALALPLLAARGRRPGCGSGRGGPGRVAVRSAVQAASMLLYFGSLPFMPIAQVGAGLFTAPLFVLLFSAALFGHRIGPRRLVAVALGFARRARSCCARTRRTSARSSLMPVAAGALYAHVEPADPRVVRRRAGRRRCSPASSSRSGSPGRVGSRRCSRSAPAAEAAQAAAPFLTAALGARLGRRCSSGSRRRRSARWSRSA